MSIMASFDIGTNTTRMLIAHVENQNIIPLVLQERITRLGLDMEKTGRLTPEAMQRVIGALNELMSLCRPYNATDYRPFATCAAREAKNQKQFIDLVSDHTGLKPRILSGEEEALLSFKGVLSDYTPVGNTLVCDIGGGSTEFIFSENERIYRHHSLSIGTRRLTSRFCVSDPIKPDHISLMHDWLMTQLKETFGSIHTSTPITVCVGGTSTTLAMMAEQIDISRPHEIHLHRLYKKDVLAIIEQLTKMSLAERQTLIGLHPDRCDVILSGALIIKSIFEYFNLEHMTVSLRDLLFGILLT
jgi:exopolyphosphatase / guanosine-5'-triphosphate,3'-diphosphate pyrophosphatase